ncbi:UNVERIFIED_CONTAM: hypothetical protein Sradi_2003700 [Sesamum radiatum]|uniref:Uncharacterized protein n=1 Tax=Sesamum radiatum TaxID=300843 RepID=A0AAW2TG68_SESRA
MASSEAKQWKEAVKSEMDSIVSNGTWKLVDLPPGQWERGELFLMTERALKETSSPRFLSHVLQQYWSSPCLLSFQ